MKQTCSIAGCSLPSARRGICNTHRLRIQRHGDPHFTKKIHTHPDEESRKAALLESRAKDYNKNREKYVEKARAWAIKNPAKAAAGVIRRQRRLKEATPSWLTEEQWFQMDSFYAEARRLTEASGEKHEVDHIVPLRGKDICGLHVPWNLQVLPMKANRSKSNRIDPEEINQPVGP